MSQAQSVRITTTTTTSSSSTLVLNLGYLKSIPGLLKLLEVVLGIICAVLIGNHFTSYTHHAYSTELFYYLIVVAFLIGSAILLISCLVSWSTGGIISKTIFELIFHVVAAILILIASILLVVAVNDNYSTYYQKSAYRQLMAAGILGIINGALYLVSAFYAQRSYKGI